MVYDITFIQCIQQNFLGELIFLLYSPNLFLHAVNNVKQLSLFINCYWLMQISLGSEKLIITFDEPNGKLDTKFTVFSVRKKPRERWFEIQSAGRVQRSARHFPRGTASKALRVPRDAVPTKTTTTADVDTSRGHIAVDISLKKKRKKTKIACSPKPGRPWPARRRAPRRQRRCCSGPLWFGCAGAVSYCRWR